jgi:hypothetical protein
MLAVSMAAEEAVAGLHRQERDVERPFVQAGVFMRAAQDEEAMRYT